MGGRMVVTTLFLKMYQLIGVLLFVCIDFHCKIYEGAIPDMNIFFVVDETLSKTDFLTF